MSVVVIVGIVVAVAVGGFVLDVIGDFEVFTVVMAVVCLGFFVVYLVLAFVKEQKKYVHPHVYSAYGLGIYRF